MTTFVRQGLIWRAAPSRPSRRRRHHGTHAAYNYHLRLGEIACGPCLEAEREYRNRRNAERRAA